MNPSLDAYRHQFPALANKLYFNYGGQGPLPTAALEEIISAYQRIQHDGPFGLKTNAQATQAAQIVRDRMAGELGVNPTNLVLTENVTVGCNIALWGIEWQQGDRILMSDCEHPGIIGAVGELQRRFGIEIDVVSFIDRQDPIASIVDRLQPQTRMVLFSHVLWNTGKVLPVAEIARSIAQYSGAHRQILIAIDGAQSVGLLPLNLNELGVDFYAFTGHKWWCGPEGVGGLFLRTGAEKYLRPTFIGWRGVNYGSTEFEPVETHLRYEIATSAYPLYAGLTAAIATHQSWGTSQVRFDRILELASYLWHGLQQLAGVECLSLVPPESGLVSFRVPTGNQDRIVAHLEAQQVYLRTIVSPHCIRACVHYFTTNEEIDLLLDRLASRLG